MAKYVLVTGASSGIGYETAKAFAARGDNVIVTARRAANLEQLKKEINEQHPEVDVVVKVCDLSDNEETVKLYESLKAYDIKAIINNAGRGNKGGFVDDALENVTVVLSGMSSMEQLEDNLSTFAEGELLSESERDLLLNKVVPELADMVPCTGCRYCMAECPMSLKIPHLISLYNEMNFSARSFYLNALKEDEMPSNCVSCGACTAVCPQSIDIPGVLQKLDAKITEAREAMARARRPQPKKD